MTEDDVKVKNRIIMKLYSSIHVLNYGQQLFFKYLEIFIGIMMTEDDVKVKNRIIMKLYSSVHVLN